MNALGLDFGTKRIGVAISVNGVIIPQTTQINNPLIFDKLQKIIDEYQLSVIYIGLSQGKIANLTRDFIEQLKTKVTIPIETVDESVSTIEAQNYIAPGKKDYSHKIDGIAAAIILQRALI